MSTANAVICPPSSLYFGDESYPQLALSAVSHALETLESADCKWQDFENGFIGFSRYLLDMEGKNPFNIPFDSSKPLISWVREEDKYKYREPVWKIFAKSISESNQVKAEMVSPNEQEQLSVFLQEVISRYLFWVFAEEQTKNSSKEIREKHVTLFGEVDEKIVVTHNLSSGFEGISYFEYLKGVLLEMEAGLTVLVKEYRE